MEYKNLIIDDYTFTIVYLDNTYINIIKPSDGKRILYVLFNPKKPMSESKVINILEECNSRLITEIKNIVNENNEIYTLFKIEYFFSHRVLDLAKVLDKEIVIRVESRIKTYSIDFLNDKEKYFSEI